MTTIEKPKPSIEWDTALTLEQWMTKMIESGNAKLVLPLLNVLPDEKKVRYRNIWKTLMEREK